MAISRARFRGWFVRGSVLAIALPALLAGPIAVATGLVVPAAMPFLVLGFVLSVLTLLASYSTRVEVGDDGVLVAPVLGRSTFVPIAEIERAEPIEGLRIRMHLRSGSHLDVETRRDENFGKPGYVRRCDALLSAMRERIDGHHEAVREADAERVIEAATVEGSDEGGVYRARIEIADDVVRQVLADGHADFAARASAATLLRRRHGKAFDRELVRIAASTAEPDLRAFLSEASELEAEAVDEALREAIRAHRSS